MGRGLRNEAYRVSRCRRLGIGSLGAELLFFRVDQHRRRVHASRCQSGASAEPRAQDFPAAKSVIFKATSVCCLCAQVARLAARKPLERAHRRHKWICKGQLVYRSGQARLLLGFATLAERIQNTKEKRRGEALVCVTLQDATSQWHRESDLRFGFDLEHGALLLRAS
ncbi:integral peroxisomal membrane protein [Pseudozyma hubeiensis SY62]|uniref:Integral peroxisomal membrane protein n=1 Tax=Pseudozyma hubeiensis (strain SY62) TaxID=1305764 RepID=R9PB90_PSEHS|nr:integral peroxisomal membrane protein [Pseudozyma hubeiensis SY62]GAC95315.1 integral peroxisomal membrane protein [Pseudozyma hubeiensis SY62]